MKPSNTGNAQCLVVSVEEWEPIIADPKKYGPLLVERAQPVLEDMQPGDAPRPVVLFEDLRLEGRRQGKARGKQFEVTLTATFGAKDRVRLFGGWTTSLNR